MLALRLEGGAVEHRLLVDVQRDRDRVELRAEPGDLQLAPLEVGGPVREHADLDALRTQRADGRNRVREWSHLVRDPLLLLHVASEQLVAHFPPRAESGREPVPAERDEVDPAGREWGVVLLEHVEIAAPQLDGIQIRDVLGDRRCHAVPHHPFDA